MAGNRYSRRAFLLKSAAVAAATSAVPCFVLSQGERTNRTANDRLLIGCIGLGTQGNVDAAEHARFGRIAAVCDVDAGRAEAAKYDRTIGMGTADTYADYRRVLDRKDIDVVSVVTPDHWHVKIAIEALQAGKHVFCQKPLTLTLEENQLIRNACRKYRDRVFVVGTQQRAIAGFLRAVNMVQKGLLGDIQKIRVGLDGCPTGGPFAKATPPQELDWNVWLGQTAKLDYIKERCHYTFRWWYEYSGGKFTDWGAHHVDIATWAIGHDKQGLGPIEIDGADAKHSVPFHDGYPTIDNCFNTSHNFAVKCKFANGIEMTVTSRGNNGVLFEGTKGRIFVNRGKITGKPIEENWDANQLTDADVARLFKGKPHVGDHKANFYQCVREGGLPISDVFSHVQTINTCHLCAIAARLGRTIRWDPKAEKIVGDDQAAALFARTPRKGFEIPKV
jgi:predicted dehydrogenase